MKGSDGGQIEEKKEKEPTNVTLPIMGREKKAYIVQVDHVNDVEVIKNFLEDPILSLSRSSKSADIMFINTQKNVLLEEHLRTGDQDGVKADKFPKLINDKSVDVSESFDGAFASTPLREKQKKIREEEKAKQQPVHQKSNIGLNSLDSLHYRLKVFRMDLLDNSSTAESSRLLNSRYSSDDVLNGRIIKIYRQAFKMLKRSLRRERLTPCIVFNLRH